MSNTKIKVETAGSRYDFEGSITLDESQRHLVLDIGSTIYDAVNAAHGGIGRRSATITVTVGAFSTSQPIMPEVFEERRFRGIDQVGAIVSAMIYDAHYIAGKVAA